MLLHPSGQGRGSVLEMTAGPLLIDGGMVTSPSLGVYGLEGHWEVENHGIPPSPGYEVQQDPKAMHEGRDPQLDKAIAVAMQMLKANPPKKYVRPPFHVYHHPLPTIPH